METWTSVRTQSSTTPHHEWLTVFQGLLQQYTFLEQQFWRHVMNFSKPGFTHFAHRDRACFAKTTSHKSPSGCKRPLWPDRRIAADDSKTREPEVLLILKTTVPRVLTSHCHNGRASEPRDGAGAQWFSRLIQTFHRDCSLACALYASILAVADSAGMMLTWAEKMQPENLGTSSRAWYFHLQDQNAFGNLRSFLESHFWRKWPSK